MATGQKRAPRTTAGVTGSAPRATASVEDAAPKRAAKGMPTKDSFQNFAARLGVGTGNLTDYSSYGLNPITRQRVTLDFMYRGSWLVGTAVDAYAEDMTKEGVEFLGAESPADVEQLISGMTKLGFWMSTAAWTKWARLYGGCIMVMLIDGQDVETPLDPDTIAKGQLKGFYVLDRWMLQPSFGRLVSDLGPHLGKPEFYQPTGEGPVYRGKNIHWTRCLRMDGVELPHYQKIAEVGWGMSIVERLFDRLQAFDSATAGAGQLIFKAYLRTLSVEGLREILGAGGKAFDALVKNVEQIRAFQASEGLTLIDAKDKFETHSYSFGGLSDILQQFGQQVSGALQIPLVRLFGQSPAGFSSGDSDLRMYYDGVGREQEACWREPFGRAFDVVYRSELGKPPPETFSFKFNPLWKVSDVEKADISSKVTVTVSGAFEAGLVGRKAALQELRQSADTTGIWSSISDDDIENAEEDPPSPDESPVGGEPGGGGGSIKPDDFQGVPDVEG